MAWSKEINLEGAMYWLDENTFSAHIVAFGRYYDCGYSEPPLDWDDIDPDAGRGSQHLEGHPGFQDVG